MEKGLKGEPSDLRMLPSYVTHMPGGGEQGVFYALDLVRDPRPPPCLPVRPGLAWLLGASAITRFLKTPPPLPPREAPTFG